jgi:hypothetical protein
VNCLECPQDDASCRILCVTGTPEGSSGSARCWLQVVFESRSCCASDQWRYMTLRRTRPVLQLSAELDGQQYLSKQAFSVLTAAESAAKLGLQHAATFQPSIVLPGAFAQTCTSLTPSHCCMGSCQSSNSAAVGPVAALLKRLPSEHSFAYHCRTRTTEGADCCRSQSCIVCRRPGKAAVSRRTSTRPAAGRRSRHSCAPGAPMSSIGLILPECGAASASTHPVR